MAGNVQDVFPAMGGVWLLGGKVSGGDIALDSKAIAGQVGKKSWSIKKTNYTFTHKLPYLA